MTEGTLILWFTSHPFTRNLCLAMLGGISAMAKADYAKLQMFKATDPHATWSWRVAAVQYAQGLLLGAGPVLASEVFHILSAS